MKPVSLLLSLATVLALPSFSSAPAADSPVSLAAAREELTELKKRYLDKHPRILVQQARIKALEEEPKAAPHGNSELREAREELSELKLRYFDKHPRILVQQARIKALEERYETRQKKVNPTGQEIAKHEAPTGGSPEVQAAGTAFDRARENYGPKHPKYQAALQELQAALQELDKTTKAKQVKQ